MTNTVSGTFEVTRHLETKDRGAFVVGHIRSGSVSVGMYIETGSEPAVLEISGVEFLDNVSEKRYWNALIFAECPNLDLIMRAFPVGSTLEVFES